MLTHRVAIFLVSHNDQPRKYRTYDIRELQGLILKFCTYVSIVGEWDEKRVQNWKSTPSSFRRSSLSVSTAKPRRRIGLDQNYWLMLLNCISDDLIASQRVGKRKGESMSEDLEVTLHDQNGNDVPAELTPLEREIFTEVFLRTVSSLDDLRDSVTAYVAKHPER